MDGQAAARSGRREPYAAPTAARIDSAVISTSRRRSSLEIESGGISTIVSPSGRIDRAALARLERHPVAEAKRRVVAPQVDPDHEPAAADLGDLGHRGDVAEQLAEQADLRLQAQQRLLGAEDLEAGERGRAAERVAR